MKIKTLTVFFILCFCGLIILNPAATVSGVKQGLLISVKTVIPSLLPITFCVSLLIGYINVKSNKYVEGISGFLFGQSTLEFVCFILSAVGGYPIGAKILSDLYKSDKITYNNARIMQNYCVFAGPGFIITAVGKLMYKSTAVGIALYLSHLVAGALLAVFCKSKTDKISENKNNTPEKCFADCFVSASTGTSAAIFNICFFVILFSSILSILNVVAEKIEIISYLKYFLEVTVAVSSTKNIYAVSFLLGFAGVSVWLQILSVNKCIDVKKFIIFRILHGGLSAVITFALIKIFKITWQTSVTNLKIQYTGTNAEISASLIMLTLLLIISLCGKKISGKLLKDLL